MALLLLFQMVKITIATENAASEEEKMVPGSTLTTLTPETITQEVKYSYTVI